MKQSNRFAHTGTESLSDVERTDGCDVKSSTDNNMVMTEKTTTSGTHHDTNGFLARQAKRIARNPCKHLWIGLVVTIAISAIGLIVGEFSVSVDAGGWQSRGTLISNRHTQLELAHYFADDIFYATDSAEEDRVWDDLLNNVQEGWEILEAEDEEEEEKERKEREKAASETDGVSRNLKNTFDQAPFDIDMGWKDKFMTQSKRNGKVLPPTTPNSPNFLTTRTKRASVTFSDPAKRSLQVSSNISDVLDTCELEWYGSQEMFGQSRLWPIWKAESKGDTALSPEAIFDICQAEEETQQALVDNDLCFGCDGTSENGCHRPYSIVLFARVTVENGMEMTCAELRDAWAPLQSDMEAQWKACVADIVATHDPNEDVVSLPDSCPSLFSVTFVDDQFANTGVLTYTSSVFATRERETDELFDIVDDFDRAGGAVKGTYDTQNEDFANQIANQSLGQDMILAMASAVIIAAAILIHTRSPFVTFIGLLQIIFSFPVAFFFYNLVGGLNYFPFLNFIGVFVVFALGADDVFVAFDKFKNTRLDMPNASVEQVAAVALPEAVSAMFLTTITTAVAFFATAICPVAPIKCFAIFLGLLIVFDYILNIVLVFPALCIYDANRNKPGCCTSCCMSLSCRRGQSDEESENKTDGDGDSPVLIKRILMSYYQILHRVRWPLFVACLVGFSLTSYFASTLELPTSGDVRVLSESIEYEKNFVWRKNLLWKVLDDAGGSQAHIIWGVKPADTGNHNDPETWSKLVLDKDFDPSSEDAQIHLLNYCPQLFDQDFASSKSGFQCSIERFDEWLKIQSAAEESDDAFVSYCDGSSGLPMSPDAFHPCLVAWSKLVNETTILSRNERVQIITFPFNSRVRFDSEYSKLDKEWKMLEDWTDEQNSAAPAGVSSAYFSSVDFWWYDTNGQMLRTAYGSAAIALAAAAVVVLLSSRSFVLTIFATFAVGYVLTSVTACLVGIGWTLGFLESICFAILIGISVDFVIHFSHAYSSLPGDETRGNRTQYALVSMGPSVLAAALTSMASTVVMAFCVITFFQKFAYVLLITIFQALVGSFVVYLTMSDCIGPSNPTQLIDRCLAKVCGGCFQKAELPASNKIENAESDGSIPV